MPTENRSSNIEMVSVPRDTIEVAVGLTRHGYKSLTDQKLDQQHAQDKLRAILAEPAQPHRPCCTIDPRDLFISLNPLGLDEKDLRKDSTGFEDPRTHGDYLLFLTGFRESHPERLNHPEPIAWMVGTAFWWTKEEAERDAAATGLPIVGLGPMTDAAEVERLRAALKFYADRDHFAEDIGSDWDNVSGEPANVLWHDSEAWFVEDGSIARAALSATSDSLQLA